MLIMQIIVILGALVAPYLIWSKYKSSKQTLYRGEATVLTMSLLPPDRHNVVDYDFLDVEIPGLKSLLVKVSRQRCASLAGTSLAVKVTITIARFPLGKPFVDTIVWPGETAAEDGGDGEFNGLILSALYLMLGLSAMMLSGVHMLAPTAVSGHLWLYSAALLLGASGFSIGMFKPAAKLDRKNLSASVLNIPLGKGMFSLLVLFALCAIGTAACFWSVGIWMLIPGLQCAFALGGLTAVLIKLRHQE